MKQYIGTKIIQAEPAYRVDGEVFVKANIVPCGVHTEDGYKVVYPDGYERLVSKGCVRGCLPEDFRHELRSVYRGRQDWQKDSRAGWNGKNQYVELGHDFSYTAPGDIPVRPVQHLDIDSQALVFVGTRGRQVGWLLLRRICWLMTG